MQNEIYSVSSSSHTIDIVFKDGFAVSFDFQKGLMMAASSVTGIGTFGVSHGVSHLIGPRWTAKEEKWFKLLKIFALASIGIHFVTTLALLAMFLKVVGCI